MEKYFAFFKNKSIVLNPSVNIPEVGEDVIINAKEFEYIDEKGCQK